MATPLLPPPSRQQEIAHERYFRKSIKRRRIVFLAFQLFKSLSTKGAFRKRVAGICFLKVKNNLCLCHEDLWWIPAIDHPSKTLNCKLYGASTKNPYTDLLMYLLHFFIFLMRGREMAEQGLMQTSLFLLCKRPQLTQRSHLLVMLTSFFVSPQRSINTNAEESFCFAKIP